MSGKKDVKITERRYSDTFSVSVRLGMSYYSRKSKNASKTPSRRSSVSSASIIQANGYALEHTLSSSSQFIDRRNSGDSFRVDRIEGLRMRLLRPDEQAMPIRFLDREKDTSDWRENNSNVIPAISGAMALDFSISTEDSTDRQSWIHLDSCRRAPNPQLDDFIRKCYIRLSRITDPAQRYLTLPPCFCLKNVHYSLGTAAGCATFAWLVFEKAWVRRVISTAMITSINGSLQRFRGRCNCDDDYRCVCEAASLTLAYNDREGSQRVCKTTTVSRACFNSDKAFPAWLDKRGYADFAKWCGKPEKARDEIAHYRNFEAKNLRFNYFGELVKLDFVRSPGSPTSLPEIPPPAPEKKRRLFNRHKYTY